MTERLQKILADGGFGSRRECEQLILEGRVEVDREIVVKLGTKVDPETQAIRVDGQTLKRAFKKYYAVNKPRGVISTSKDPGGRLRVIDLIPTDQRVYTVGRLDKDSEGLIIVTNDGSLADRLTHPRYGVEKTYLIQVEGHPTREQMDSLVTGVYLAEGFVQIKHYKFKRKQKHTTEIEIVLDEGRNREVRRLLAKIGHKVLFLRRIAIGSYELEGIPFGGHRQLSSQEVESLTKNPRRQKSRSAGKSGKKAKRKTASPKGISKNDSTRKKKSAAKNTSPSNSRGGKKKSARSSETSFGSGRKSSKRDSSSSKRKKVTPKRGAKKKVSSKKSGSQSAGKPKRGSSNVSRKKSASPSGGRGRSKASKSKRR